jgi:hypothetical protein
MRHSPAFGIAAQIVRGYLDLDLFSAGGKSMSQTLL